MAKVLCEVDSVRVAAACPDKLTLILKQKESPSSYLPMWISQHEGQTLANVLNRRPDSDGELDLFLIRNEITYSDVKRVTVDLEGSSFRARVLLSRHREHCGVGCPIGLGLALAVRANAPILVDAAVFDNAGVHLE
ncbi:MAG: bifunctional nuclease domain-containing protein [Dehalococcoidia bacterium]